MSKTQYIRLIGSHHRRIARFILRSSFILFNFSNLFVLVTDRHGYVRALLGVKGDIFNLMPIAQLLEMPMELQDQVRKAWKADDGQLEVILQYWLTEKDVVKDLAALRIALEGLKQGYFLETIVFFREAGLTFDWEVVWS